MAEGGAERIHLTSQAVADVEAYLEYKRIVGDADKDLPGGIMTPEQYEHFKKTVVVDRIKNRLFVSWTNPDGMDCKLVGPETPCFCGHRYKAHRSDYNDLPPHPIPVPCQERGCRCRSYRYLPSVVGTQPPRCTCKHTAEEHDARAPHACKRSGNACACRAYRTSYRCECGHTTADHAMIVETREERLERGKPVGKVVPYAAMGGITGFSSLIDGYRRLDDSGIGAPSAEELRSPMPAECKYFMPPSQLQAQPAQLHSSTARRAIQPDRRHAAASGQPAGSMPTVKSTHGSQHTTATKPTGHSRK
ncbi:protein FAM221A-like [Sycon ciliatum]|uniref:protein FAM221A-like n=1 Tax=Sycon ciliatum TaxID=27933 RepID=UPI0031F6FF8B